MKELCNSDKGALNYIGSMLIGDGVMLKRDG